MDKYSDTQLASVTTELGQTIYSLLTGGRTPAIHASSLAAYSRSAKSLPELLRYRDEKGIDAGEVLNRIISTYNHDSVRGLGHLSVAMEDIDCITAMQFFYNHHIQDGQERSTRYQDFTRGGRKYAPCPTPHNAEGYYKVLDYWLDGVEYFTPIVRQYLQDRFYVVKDNPALTPRTLDCVRYLIPMGMSTNVGAIQSGREWSKWISTLHNLGQDTLAKGMELLLRDGWEGYHPEGDVLIRHTEGMNTPIEDLKNEVVRRGEDYEVWEPNISITDTYAVTMPGHSNYFHGVDPLLIHLYLLRNPRMRGCHLTGNATHRDGIPKLLTKYSWQHEVGPIGSNGAIAIHGMADIGTIKDLQRHRSCSTFIPLLHPESSVCGELEGTPWSIHPYLVGTTIGDDIQEYLSLSLIHISEPTRRS